MKPIMEKYHGNTVEYWKQNAEENYLTTPISVLKYISVLEEQALRIHDVSGMCEHPWASVIGDGEMKPAKCLKCGKYL